MVRSNATLAFTAERQNVRQTTMSADLTTTRQKVGLAISALSAILLTASLVARFTVGRESILASVTPAAIFGHLIGLVLMRKRPAPPSGGPIQRP